MSTSPNSNSGTTRIFTLEQENELFGIVHELWFLSDAVKPWLDEVSGSNQEVNLGLATILEKLGDRLNHTLNEVWDNEAKKKSTI